jgi:23S rRNA pseudouridine2605 synthase
MNTKVRLQKHIADIGICSRRKAEKLIKAGLVKVNGEIIREMGVKIEPEKDKVEVAEKRNTDFGLQTSDKNIRTVDRSPKTVVYIALNKPIDYITSSSSEQGASVLELITQQHNNTTIQQHIDLSNLRLYPVGRLDKDSEGLVLLTNDGEFTNQITHPKYEHEKEYEVTISEKLNKDAKKVLESGMVIDGKETQGIKIIKEWNKGKRIIVTVVLKEGKNRQIRKMFGRLGYRVQSLKRTRVGNLKLGILPVGKWKFVKKSDIV